MEQSAQQVLALRDFDSCDFSRRDAIKESTANKINIFEILNNKIIYFNLLE